MHILHRWSFCKRGVTKTDIIIIIIIIIAVVNGTGGGEAPKLIGNLEDLVRVNFESIFSPFWSKDN